MARILMGDIVWADLNPVKGPDQAKLRPALILSPEIFNDHSGTVIALALTSQPQRAGFPLTMEITSVSLPKPTWVKISQIRTLSIERLGKRMGHVSDAEMSQIVEGFNEIIGEQTKSAYRR